MICWRCGAEMDDSAIACTTCGAERPRTRRRQAANEAAKNYQKQMQVEDREAAAAKLQAQKEKIAEKPAPAPVQRKQGQAASSRPAIPPASRDVEMEKPRPTKRGGSMPPSKIVPGPAQPMPVMPKDIPMVKRHAPEVVVPQLHGYDRVNWLRLCIIAVSCVLVLVVGIYLFLTQTSPGQRLLAANGREASKEAYQEIGRMYLADGSISQAIWAFEIAQAKDPENLEILVDLGKAYMASNNTERAEMALTRAIQLEPHYPESYRLLIDMMLGQERNFEAQRLAEMALEATEDSMFSTMLSPYIPKPPGVSMIGKIFTEEQDIELSAEEGETIFYVLTDADLYADGIKYTGGQIHLPEGYWKLRAVAVKDNMISAEQVQTYIINKPIPDMPSASPASGQYDRTISVTLRAGKDAKAIYYTVDGTQATTKSKLYEGPIQLAIGKTTLRAIAVNVDDIVSNEMSLTYECAGRSQYAMSEKDTVAGLTLFGTTRSAFEEKYGAPTNESYAGEDSLGKYTKLDYAFGHAVFVDRLNNKEPVLAELSTTSSAFDGPRSTGIGSSMNDVLSAYRDVGGEASANGNRKLYSLDNNRLGMLTRVSDTAYTISYYISPEGAAKQYIELTYHVENDVVTQLEWLRYISQ